MPCTTSPSSRDRAQGLPNRRRLAWVVCCGVLCAACNAVMGFEEGSIGSPSGAAGTGGGATGGASSGTEDCLDRLDNNGDGLADCEDADCSPAYQCEEPAGQDWIGGWLHVGDTPPACGGGTLVELFDPADLEADAASCTCGCEDSVTSCLASLRCGYNCGATDYAGTAADVCSTMNVTTDDYACWAINLRAGMDACEPVGVADPPPVTWPPVAWLCQWPNGGHCPGADVCVPAPEPGGIGPCVASTAGELCPPELPIRREFADGTLADSRSCNAVGCTCGTPSGGSCDCVGMPCGVELHNSADCGTSVHAVALVDGDCVAKMTATPAGEHDMGIVLIGATVQSPGTCTPGGLAAAEGEAIAAGTLTVCCAEALPAP